MSIAKPVLISGAGIAGLSLARSLRSHKIPFVLYERDSVGASRTQGYRIRISSQGQDALRAIMNADDYRRFEAGCSDNGAGKITPLDAVTLKAKTSGGPSGGAPGGGKVLGVDRAFLRNQLFEGIEDVVQFGKHTIGYALTESGVIAKFADGSESPEGSLLVGTDGVHSAVTKQLTKGQLKVFDTGARMIHGSSPFASFAGLGVGVFSLSEDSEKYGKLAMITNVREGEEKLGWVLVGQPGSFSAPNDDFSLSGKPAADLSKEITSNWSTKVRPVLDDQVVEEAAFLKMATSDPKGVPEWEQSPRVTLMGDAVHAMTPAGGVGANVALRDAEFLGRLLGSKGGWWNGVTEAFEKEMRVYASENVKHSFETASRMFTIKDLKRTIN
ncbi:Uu.00g068700.m01.CDS01 [Anthostomella pinea]|uniref:Uu.00g068700.m01.CDS01 n=1 Tax=Anthostomella pinea TaxID=933095 RepID=A0AAI8VV05_9PEZI|nr:Uu.00g068700.m01.CDS01 [Anthostomella pinea]